MITKEEKMFRTLNSYSELEDLITKYNEREYFVDVYERNIYLSEDPIEEVLNSIKEKNNMALFLNEDGIAILELEILLSPLDSNTVNFFISDDDRRELYYDYHFCTGIKSLKHLSDLTKKSFSYLFKQIAELNKRLIKHLKK